MSRNFHLLDPRRGDCFTAQTIPEFDPDGGQYLVNSDIGGVAVAVSTIIINLALPILLRWSRSGDDVQTSILMLISQVYPVLLATAGSIGSENLSLFDAHFAVAVTASPLSVYLAWSAYVDLITFIRNVRNPKHPRQTSSLFQKITSGGQIIKLLGLLLPILWLAVNLTTTFYSEAFRGSSQHCKNIKFWKWLEFQAVSNFVGVLDVMGRRDLWDDLQGRGGLGAVSLATMWVWAVYLVRHRLDIYDEFLFRRRRRGRVFFLWVIPVFVYDVICCSWFVISHAHPWTVIVIVICLHWSWILGIAKGMILKKYQLSYGQITSLFTAFPPLISVARLLFHRRHDLKEFCYSLPQKVAASVRYLATGSRNPWLHYSRSHTLGDEELTAITQPREAQPAAVDIQPHMHRESACFWVIIILVWIIATIGDILWIGGYVRGGSRPNPRTLVNKPHEVWKPFSVSLYIYGYCVCCVNILVWTTYYGKHGFRVETPMGGLWRHIRFLESRGCIRIIRTLNAILLPIAFVMCTAPLFSPFAALPLAQQWQWDHFCDTFDGYAILDAVPRGSTSAAFFLSGALKGDFVFYWDDGDTFRQSPTNNNISGLLPVISSIGYNLTNSELNVSCIGGSCGVGSFNASKGLQFALQTWGPPGDQFVNLGTVDDEWMFKIDAPSLILNHLVDGLPTGELVLQTAVTSRSHCETLKVCLGSKTADIAMLAPVGLILRVQANYAHYCTQPRMYPL